MKFTAICLLLLASIGLASAADIESGKKLVAERNCASCHGADYFSSIAPTYPRLAGQHEDYLYYALRSYQVETNANYGRKNAVMGSQAKGLTDPQIRNIAAYLASLPGPLVVKK
jgi:cytochrome c553